MIRRSTKRRRFFNVSDVHANDESDIVALLDQLFTTSYDYTSASGTQSLIAGDEVLDDSTGTPQIYTYNGPAGLWILIQAFNITVPARAMD